MRSYSITIDGKSYNGTTASAKNQFEALHIAGKYGLVVHLKDDISDMASVTLLLQIPFEEVNRLVALLITDQVKFGEVPVAENLFVDNIQNYYLLLAKVMYENLGNFWKLRPPTKGEGGKTGQNS